MAQINSHMGRPVSLASFGHANGRSTGISPLASPTASTDSGHPSPDSSQTFKTAFLDQEDHSDISEVSTSSRSSQEADSKTQESLLSQLRNGLSGSHRGEHRRSVSFAESGHLEGEEPPRKRARSVAGVSDVFTSASSEHLRARSMLYRGLTTLPTVTEIKTETGEKHAKPCQDSQEKSEVLGRRPLGNYDSRLDAARSLVNLGSNSFNPSMYPFPPDLAYPEMMFPRLDAMRDFQHLRTPFDFHNACCIGGDPYSLAMRRWLSSPDMFRGPYNPLLPSPSGLMTPAERLRYFQFSFGYPYPFAPPSPFDLGAGLSERNLPEFALRSLHRNGPSLGSEGGASIKSTGQVSPPRERKPGEKRSIKVEQVENGGEETDSAKEEVATTPNVEVEKNQKEGNSDDEAKFVDVVGGTKSVDSLRQTLTGIQEAFSSRLENLKSSLSQSLDRDNPSLPAK